MFIKGRGGGVGHLGSMFFYSNRGKSPWSLNSTSSDAHSIVKFQPFIVNHRDKGFYVMYTQVMINHGDPLFSLPLMCCSLHAIDLVWQNSRRMTGHNLQLPNSDPRFRQVCHQFYQHIYPIAFLAVQRLIARQKCRLGTTQSLSRATVTGSRCRNCYCISMDDNIHTKKDPLAADQGGDRPT